MQPIPVICDVDTGVDDAMALLLAVRHPAIDLRAVTCVVGNVSLDQVVANTLYVLDAAGAGDVPVARGASRPLLAPAQGASHVHGVDGLGGFSRPSDRRMAGLSAIELLRRELTAAMATGDRITLVPLAPMTNIALLLRTYPDVAAGIERIVFMGGAAGVGNATPVAEFNVWHDPEAAAMTLAACGELDIPITMYGLDVFGQVVVDGDDGRVLRGRPDAGAQLAGALIEVQRRVYGTEAITIGDAGAVCAVIDPDGIGTARYPVRVELGAGFARGQTIVDRRAWSGDRHRDLAGPGPVGTPVDVALTVDAARFAELWLDTVGG
jgi:pyrimidine-specific ribonucleoside hydrolase